MDSKLSGIDTEESRIAEKVGNVERRRGWCVASLSSNRDVCFLVQTLDRQRSQDTREKGDKG